MTEQIDLDDLDTGDEQAEEEDAPNRGDWFWRGEGDPDEEPGAPSWGEGSRGADEGEVGSTPDAADSTPEGAAETAAGADGDADDAATAEAGEGGANRLPASPHVPSDNAGTPAGIPVQRGGGGAGEASSAGTADDASGGEDETAESAETRASGPHGGGADDMTTAFTYRAAKRLANPAAAFAEAEQWSDWLGIVGDAEAHVLGAFQRNETIDADFFNGSGTGPAERLAGIGPHSMFFADRMVVVGVAGEDEAIAEEAGWEFVPLEDAAAGAGWELVDGADGEESGDADADDGDDAETGGGADGDEDGADPDADESDDTPER